MPGWGIKIRRDTISPILREAPRKIKQQLNFVLQEAGQQMEQSAIRRVPVRTGYLRSTIFYRVWAQTLKFGATADYAPHVEFGTRFMAAQPFLRPAFDEQVRAIKTAFMDALRKIFKS